MHGPAQLVLGSGSSMDLWVGEAEAVAPTAGWGGGGVTHPIPLWLLLLLCHPGMETMAAEQGTSPGPQ